MATQVSWMDWLVQTNDIKQLWAAQPSYLLSQAVYLFAGLVTLLHAIKKGGRWPYFWLGTVLHGVWADNFWHFVVPEYDNFWHSQTPVMLLGARLPLHIVFLYPAFIYHAAYAISRLNLPRYAQPFAVGLLTVLIDIPYDITAVKFVHWTWHDTDPNIYDRHYWVPWNSYYFHATFAAGFYYLFQVSRGWFAPKVADWNSAGLGAELKSMIFASVFGMFCGVLMFVPIYHPLHDMYKIHSEVTFFILFALFAGIVLCGLASERKKPKDGLSGVDYILIFQLIVHYALYLGLVIYMDPQREVSTGLHEPVGPCDLKASLITPFGQKVYKRKYFCVNDYDEGYFDFSCVKELPKNGATWYTICGKPFENRAEYVTVLATIVMFASIVFEIIYSQKPEAVQSRKKSKRE